MISLNRPQLIWIAIFSIMVLGVIILFSATFNNVRVEQDVFYDQIRCSILSLGLIFLLSRIHYRKFYDLAYVLYIFNIFLLLLVFIMGRFALGAQRWLQWGSFSFQPSEVMKISIILMLARYFSDRRPTLSFDFFSKSQIILHDIVIPFLITILPVILIFLQPDLGTALLIFGIFIVLLFLSNLESRYLWAFGAICLAFVPWGWKLLRPYQKDRLLVFLNPNIDPLGSGYTIIQSKIAVGSGQLLGKGWLAGTQSQLNFLPERHTDFIFSVVGEEWGFVGALVLVMCFSSLINLGFKVMESIKDKFGMMLGMGIVSILAFQVVINLGMVLGLFPVVGITLPFVSYGRTSYLTFAVLMGLLLNLSRQRTIF